MPSLPPATRSAGWHRVYYALGAFNVVSVLAAIALSYTAMSGYSGSIAVNEAWAARLGRYQELARTASRADAPGNDVFENRDVDGERAHLATSRRQFVHDLQAAYDELAHTSPALAAPQIARLGEAGAAFTAMMAEAERIFAAFRDHDHDGAGHHMAAMDRHFSHASETLGMLIADVRAIQRAQFLHQESDAGRLHTMQYLLGCVVLLIVAAIIAYGRKLALVFARQQATIDARNRDLRLVLDHVAQGFLTIDLHGVMSNERSAILDRWFGVPAPGGSLQDLLEPRCPEAAAMIELGLGSLRDDFMPPEVVLDQLPHRLELAARIYDVAFLPILAEPLAQLLVVVSDVTELVAREVADREQGEMVRIFQRISVDRSGVEEFLLEAGRLVTQLRDEQDPVVQKRIVHTLKGNCAIYGLSSYAAVAQRVESELADTGDGLSPAQRHLLEELWRRAMHRVASLLGNARRDVIEIDPGELATAAALATGPELAALLDSWRREPVVRRFERLALQVTEVARRVGKPEPTIEIHGNGIRMQAEGRTAFWAAMIHVVRNAVDHGIEDEATRLAAGKPAHGQVVLTATRAAGRVVLRVSDDGRGIDWDAIRARAAVMGLPCTSPRELTDVIFRDGLTTRETATEISGRGVGLAALAQVVAQLGGEIGVESAPGRGTTVSFAFDEAASELPGPGPRPRTSSLLPQFV
jgi:signal transduction histidine kinase